MKPLSNRAFDAVTRLFHSVSGIKLTEAKHALVTGRLQRMATEAGEPDLEAYVDKLLRGGAPAQEMTKLIDRLTTNETYFFREPAHYALIEQEILRTKPLTLAVWSAAASFGDEAYSTAMLLADLQQRGVLGSDWRVLGTDISDRVLRSAVEGIYPEDRLRDVSPERLRRHCLRGSDTSAGLVQMGPRLRERVRFGQLNLCQPIDDIGPFDIVLLRNVLIYFDAPTKAAVVDRVLTQLRPGGLFFIGTAEGRVACSTPLQPVAPGAFRKT